MKLASRFLVLASLFAAVSITAAQDRVPNVPGIDTSGMANLTAFMARMTARPAVQEAMKAEGLLK